MMKTILASLALAGIVALGAPSTFAQNPIMANAEDDSELVSEDNSEEQSILSEEEGVSEQSEAEPEPQSAEEIESSPEHVAPKWVVKEARIFYRDADDTPYVASANPEQIGSYFLSADGWEEGDDFVITMNAKGALTTKLESKVMYIYEYRPTLVEFAGVQIAQNEDKTYTLEKPELAGEYDLSISFTKTLIVNPVELANVDWQSFITVPNLMTVLSWAVIVVGFFVVFFLNRKYKKDGATTLQSIKNSLNSYVEDNFGKEVSAVVSDAFDNVVKKSFDAIDAKLSKVDNNNAVLVRCLLLMQENTPEARLAITECLSKLDVAEDKAAEQVRAIIEAEIQKYKDEQAAKEEAIRKAKELNESWAEEEPKAEEKPEEPSGDDGTRI